MDKNDRVSKMVALYGETCCKADAARILGVCRTKLYEMLHNGEIKTVMNGKRIDVRYLAEMIEGGK